MRLLSLAAVLITALLLPACSGSNNSPSVPDEGGETPSDVTAAENRRVEIPSPVEGSIVFQLFTPERMQPGERYPLVLHSHGFGGSRQTEATGLIGTLVANGYYVISIDQRGFGESTGPVRVMDPDAEGRDLVAILDWAETELSQLQRDASGTMMVGAYGSSYGGGYQLLLQAVDSKARLRALVPDITWHDLTESLNPGDAIKSGWALVLVAGGEAGSQGDLDNVIRETLLRGLSSNRFPEPGLDFFRYHSPRYFCDGEAIPEIAFAQGTEVPMTPPNTPPAADILLWQGFPDTLFNVTEAFDNLRCLRARGGDVRLLTHQSGHILPLSVETLSADLDSALAALSGAVVVPEFQGPGGRNACGSIDRDVATLAWFEAKLKGRDAALEEAIPTGDAICLSLAEGDAVAVADIPEGGSDFPVEASTPAVSGLIGVATTALGPGLPGGIQAIPLQTIGQDGAVLAGQPTMQLTLSPVNEALAQAECLSAFLPLACDPIVYVGVGYQRDGQWQLIDDQLKPLRGFGAHGTPQAPERLVAVAERLQPGDTLGLLVYGFHPQYLGTFSRDVLVPALTISGRVQLPLLSAQDIVAEGF
ncbi:MAG: alpha/beta hydrolase [Algiphilus sp.]